MILRRLGENLRVQNWTNVAIELAIVIVGVFIGIQAANWNQQRLERRETEQLLEQVDVELTAFNLFIESLDDYYVSAGRYGDRATAGWRGDASVSDEEFVIAAYQASQINGVSNSAGVWGAIFGAENLRDIEDPVIRQNLAGVMTFDYALVDIPAVATRYREEVRKTIPHDIQSAIRARCNDKFAGHRVSLPLRCDIEIPPGEATRAAEALRARPDLVAELYWHRAAVATQLTNVAALRTMSLALTRRIGGAGK